MRVHPSHYGADGFTISLEADASGPYVDLFHEMIGAELEEERRYALASIHDVPDRQWVDIALVARVEDSFSFSVSYGLDHFPKPPTNARRLQPAIRALSDSGLVFKVTVHALFRFEGGMKRSVLALPIKLFHIHGSAPFDKIEGMELVRSPKGPAEPKYTLDVSVMPETEELIHGAHIQMERPLARGFETSFLKTARDFSQEFILGESLGGQ